MSDEQWLREGLADAVPPPPTNPDRARGAASLARRRRRTTTLAVLGTVGAVAAVAVLTATLTSGGDDPDVADNQTASDPATIVDCPPAKARDGVVQSSEIDEPDPDAPEAVPEGATSARLCQGPGTTFEVPGNALVTDVDGLVAVVNDLGQTPEHEMCTSDLGPGFRIAFGYDDGSTFVVSGQLYGCRTLVVGNGYRADPEAAQQEILDRLRAQREAGDDPSDTQPTADVVACPDGPTFDYDGIDDVQEGLPDAVPEGATSVRLCAGGGIPGAEPLDALTTDVATLVDTVNSLPDGVRGACTDELGPGYRLAFGYPDGTRFLVVGRFYGCANVVVGSGYRDDPQVPLDTFIELLRAQRTNLTPPGLKTTARALDCGQSSTHPTQAIADPNEMVAAMLCIGRTGLRIPDEDLPALIEDLRTHQDTQTTGACRAQPTRIVGVTQWGDMFSLHSECGMDSYALPGSQPRFWNTSREIELLLENLAVAD